MNDTQNTAIVTATNAVTAAMDTLATSTLPPLVAALKTQINAVDPTFPMLGRGTPAQQALYLAFVQYINQQKAAGTYTGIAFPIP
jgi:hypothetical protein